MKPLLSSTTYRLLTLFLSATFHSTALGQEIPTDLVPSFQLPVTTGIYQNCMDDIVHTRLNVPIWVKLNQRNKIMANDIQYMPDYDIQTFLSPKGPNGTYLSSQEDNIDEIVKFYEYIKDRKLFFEVGLVIDRRTDAPIFNGAYQRTSAFYISTDTADLELYLSCPNIWKDTANLDLEFRDDSLTYILTRIEELNDKLNPDSNSTQFEVFLSEKYKLAALVMFPRYKRTKNGQTIQNEIFTHGLQDIIDVISLDHEYWRYDISDYADCKDDDNCNYQEVIKELLWSTHRQMLIDLRDLITVSCSDIILEDYVVLGDPGNNSSTHNDLIPKAHQANNIGRRVDRVVLVGFDNKEDDVVDVACEDIEVFGSIGKPVNYRILVNMWSNGTQSDASAGGASQKIGCWGGNLGNYSNGNDPGMYYRIGHYNNSLERVEQEIQDEIKWATDNQTTRGDYINCPNFDPGMAVFTGVHWNSMSHFVYYTINNQPITAKEAFAISKTENTVLSLSFSEHKAEVHNEKGDKVEGEFSVFNLQGQLIRHEKNTLFIQLNSGMGLIFIHFNDHHGNLLTEKLAIP